MFKNAAKIKASDFFLLQNNYIYNKLTFQVKSFLIVIQFFF